MDSGPGSATRRYKDLVEHGGGLMCMHDLDGALEWVGPAIARLLGYDASAMRGRSLADFMAEPDRLPAYLEADRSVPGPWRTTPASAIRRGSYKLVHFFEGDRWELYDLAEDVSESRDISGDRPGLLRQMRGALEEWWVLTDAAFLLEPNPAYAPGE